jgi:ABC-type lipoprotein release transport system permease subunit
MRGLPQTFPAPIPSTPIVYNAAFTLTVAAPVLVTTMVCACYLPARRAALIDPARTLADG